MNLVMLTKFYPFGTGEAFIENEVKVMSEYYDQIVIIACEVPKNENRKRELPKNAKAYKILAGSKKIDALWGLVNFRNSDTHFKNEKKECNTILQRCFLDYFEEKCQRTYQNILNSGALDEITSNPFSLYSYWFFMTARVGILISENVKPEMMFTRAHRYDLYEDKNKTGYLPYRKLFLEKYNYVFPCSDNGTNHLKILYPNCSGNVETSLLGTLDHGIGIASEDGVFRIVSCSRVEPVKRVEKIVDALAELDEGNLNIEWTHIGDGSGLESLKKYTTEKLKHTNVIFKGNMKNKDVMQFYATHPFDLFVNVSSSEGLPVSIMEAMSFGMPCVATDVGGTSEIVINDLTGKLIPCEFKTKKLASIIAEFVNCNADIDYRKVCRQYWYDNFQAIPNYHKLYVKLDEYCRDSVERNLR